MYCYTSQLDSLLYDRAEKNSGMNISQTLRETNFLQTKDGFDWPVLYAKKLTNRVTKVICIICGILHDLDSRNADKISDTLVTIIENDAREDKQGKYWLPGLCESGILSLLW